MHNMKIIVQILVLVAFYSRCFGQTTFQKTYGNAYWDWASDVLTTSEPGYLILGSTNFVGASDTRIYLVKTGGQGDLKWTKIYGNVNDHIGMTIANTVDGNYIIAAQESAPQTLYPLLIKINDHGDIIYSRKFSEGANSRPRCVIATYDSGAVMTGEISRPNAGAIFLLKTNKAGDLQWSKAYRGAIQGNYQVESMIQTSDSGYALVGTCRFYSVTPNTHLNLLLIKLNSVGDIQWTKVFGGTIDDKARDVIQTSDGGYMLTGTVSNVAHSYEVSLIKTNAIGDTLWTRSYGGVSYDEGYAVKQLIDDSYVVFGQTQSFGTGDLDCYLLKVDSSGDLQWSKKYGGPSTDFSYGLQLTSDDGFVLAGGAGDLGPGAYDVYLIKTDSDGNSGCYETRPSTARSFIPLQVSSAPMNISNAGFSAYNYPIGIQSGGIGMEVCHVNETQTINEINQQIVASPNPFTSEIRISSRLNGEVVLFDIAGNIILRQKIISGVVSLNTENVAPGFYILVFTTNIFTTYFKMLKD